MKILVDINHPAHVHFFRNAMSLFQKQGHRVIITASHKDIAIDLLREYSLEFIDMGSYGNSVTSKTLMLLVMDIKMFWIYLKHRPDYSLGIASSRICHPALFFKVKSLVFDDTDHAKLQKALYWPFAYKIYSPSCYLGDLGKKHIKYEGYHELAYLHPNRFTPDPAILKEINVLPGEKYFVVRFVSWGAAHDIGHKGFSTEGKRTLVKLLEQHGKVFITSETGLPADFDRYLLKVSPIKIHHLLYYAEMYVGEGGTMATEAAILGTPSIFVSTLTAGVFQELEQQYGIQFSFQKEEMALAKIRELLAMNNLKHLWGEKRKKLLEHKIDVTEYIVNQLADNQKK